MKNASRPDAVERLARRRAAAKLGWYLHAAIYLLVNLLLLGLAASQGRQWAIFPLLGWGLGLAIHGAVVFFVARGGNLYERLLARERRALGAGDPW